MGMTDAQFKAHLRSLISRLHNAEKTQNWELIEELKEELQKALEDQFALEYHAANAWYFFKNNK